MPTTEPTFTPTTKRGRALLLHVLEIIEAEARADGYGDIEDISRAGHWNQGTWGEVRAEDLIAQGLDFDALLTESGAEPGRAVDLALPVSPVNLCGTACCFAGHTTFQVGDTPVVNVVANRDWINTTEVLAIMDVRPVDHPGLMVPVSTRAMELLGLESDEADLLFEADNTLADLRVIIEYLTNGVGIVECDACGERPWNCPYRGDEVCSVCDEHPDTCVCYSEDE
ncbi:hypothetical protein SEA_NHAGOS_71 [Gordonia phage NHagos]|nr:hypothetical protein SEA_NHAGOS_71 [Gordonia phage NHagos]